MLVTGGAGYVGSALVPKLLDRGWDVTVADLFLFGDHLPPARDAAPRLVKARVDIRDAAALQALLPGHQAVIHLACISNDPSFELHPALSRTINYECFEPLVTAAKAAGVERFVYASTSSVYGVSDAPEITEDHPLVPLTEYNHYKALCEPVLLRHGGPGFTPVIIRPATVCGWSPRLRLDLTVNILTASAIETGRITVLGGRQQRPSLHVDDMTDLYATLLEAEPTRIAGRTWNASYQNHTVAELAEIVRGVVAREVPGRERIEIVRKPSSDLRSYHVSSERIERELGFAPKRTIEDAVRDLCRAFLEGKVPGALDDPRYHNVRTIRAAGLR